MRAGIALGSNLGDRECTLKQAIGHLKELHESGSFLVSGFHETEPEGCPPESPRFLNAVAEISTSRSPLDLLHDLQELEIRAGRPRLHERNGPRTLDLDLLYCDEMTLRHPDLELPHPRMLERAFVLAPLSEIRPDLKLPSWEMSALKYLLNINKNKC
jgi:2-amino-4-hydroxy-6-hydroxymethyldihydropteridine diphosphokinase